MASDEDDDGFLGTPFAPLEKGEVVSRKPELDLTVRDSRGRRRFHGAFTGGFSAGHFMTVGSEEGFTPQQYISNRQQRWDQSLVQRKPENFMDSEDLDVFGIAPKKITTKDEFTEQEFAGFRKTDSLIDVLKTVIQPTTESIGRKLYKRMKLNARNVSKDIEPKVYGCEAILEKPNTIDLSYKSKSDLHGIGYKSMAEESDGSNSKASNGVSAVFKSGRKLKISGEAFGYGVLEDDDDVQDDAVVYHKDDMSQYDYEIGSIKTDRNRRRDKPKELDILKGDVIDGFSKGSAKINLFENIRLKYPVPPIPKGWKRPSLKVDKQKRSRWDQPKEGSDAKETISLNEDKTKNKTPVLNANIRAVLLGEEVIHRQGVRPSDREKTKETISGESSVVKPVLAEKNAQKVFDKPLTGFWANKFTRSDIVEQTNLSGGLTEFKSKESDSKDVKEDKQALEAKNKLVERTSYEWHPHNLLCKRFNIPNPFPQYPDFVGVVTVGKSDVRNRTSFVNDKKAKPNIFDCLFTEKVESNTSHSHSVVDDTNPKVSNEPNQSHKTIERKDLEEDGEEKENEETPRPPMDLFKAIFASDEESDSEDSDTDQRDSKEASNQTPNTSLSGNTLDSKSSEPNANKSSGVFANIDFDQLNRDFTPVLKTNESQNRATNETNVSQTDKISLQTRDDSKQSEPNDDCYGPALPPDSSLYSAISLSTVSSDSRSRSSKRKKKEKKHKKHKKHKTDHKKHRHRSSSESDSSVDIEEEILVKLKGIRK